VGRHSIAPHGRSGHSEAVVLQLEALLGIALPPGEKLHTELGLQCVKLLLELKDPAGFGVSAFTAQIMCDFLPSP